MGFLKAGAGAVHPALEGFDDPELEPLREAANSARLANRKTFVARLPLAAVTGSAPTEVRSWSAALQQVGQHDWTLTQWSVAAEPSGPVAYAVFVR